MIFYFSGTGNSRWVTDTLARAVNEQTVDMAEALRQQPASPTFTPTPDERVGFVFPVYGWGLPAIVEQFIGRLTLKGYRPGSTFLYFVCTCGDDIGCLRRLFEKAIAPKGWTLDSAFSVVMPDSYVCLPGFDVDGEELCLDKLYNSDARMNEVSESIRARQHTFSLNPGPFPHVKSYVLRPLFNRYLVTDKPFRSTPSCIGCGRCVSACPLHNIVLENGRPVWKGHCTACLSCYHHCPVRAIEFGRFTRGKGQYLYEKYGG